MVKCLVLLVFALVVAVSGYDFKDSDFNNYLFEEFQEVLNADNLISDSRQRREIQEETPVESKKECTRRDWKKDFQCCIGDKFDTKQHEAYMDAKKQCYTELRENNDDESFDPFDCEKMQKVKEQMFCVSECVAKKFNSIDEDGALKRDVLLAQVRAMAGEVPWKLEASERIVDKCLDEVKEKHSKAIDTAKGCNQCPMEFHYCLWREIANGCPAELRIDTPKCNRLRERLAKGDNSSVHKHFLHFLHSRRHED